MARGKGRSGKRPKNKKPPPNRHTLASRIAKQREVQDETESESEQPPRPSSASENKLPDCDATVDPQRESWSGFRVVDIDKIFGNITECVACQKCRGNVKITEIRRVGLSSVFNLECERKCGLLKRFRNSELVRDNPTTKFETEANRRFVLASQALGVKHAGLKTLCAMMDLPPPISQKLYDSTLNFVHTAVQEEANVSMLRAAEEESELSGTRDVKASGDGSWQKRGYSSKNGVVSLIGAESGKVLDVEVMSTVCFGCFNYKGPKEGPTYDEWKEGHEAECSVNHEASSGMMEVEGMVKIFKRSEARAGVRFESYIGDGDAKTFPAIQKALPYGNDLIPKKIECTGHVQKRMGTRLRNLKKDPKSKKLSDGKSLGGRGRLTDKKIDQIASFYGNAVRSSKTVKEMKDKIWAIFYHYRSTDKKPQHHLCPKGADSWCKYQKAVSEGQASRFKHSSSLPEAVMDAIKCVFTDLSKDDLLVKCIGGYTQNPNESFNSVVWKYVPKTIFCSRKVLEIGVYSAVLNFNDGLRSQLKVLTRLGITPGRMCVNFCNELDRLRISKSVRRSLDSTKEARKARRQQDKELAEKRASTEGVSYAPGAF